MRRLAAVAATLAMMGWSGAETAETRIGRFTFGCEILDGTTLKPKFGDVDGAHFGDLPAQRQQCLEAINRKIELCGENVDFASNARNREFPGCVSLFREQAQACTGHFELERAKCNSGGIPAAEAVSPDWNERQGIQAALAAAGFSPGPIDGIFGPKTRRATRAWQEAKGYAGSGELTRAQAEALLGGTAPPESAGPNWIVAENQPCLLYDPTPESGETVNWSGACADGKASGVGQWVLQNSDGEHTYTGHMRGGKIHGRGTFTWSNGGYYEGEWREGKPHGHGTLNWTDGGRYEGEWRDGCFDQDGRRAWVGSRATCGFE